MANSYFRFKQFTISQAHTAMKVTTDSCLFGAWIANQLNEQVRTVLDIGAGTALLSLMIAQENNCSIEAVEIEPAAAHEAVENIRSSPWATQLKLREGNINTLDLGKYDCIISNPPFYEKDLNSPAVNKNIAHHSHDLTLAELMKIISEHLAPTGIFFLLIPYRRKTEILNLIKSKNLFVSEIIEVSHSRNHLPARLMILGTRQAAQQRECSFFIQDETGKYSDEFIHLLKKYYLYL